MDESSIIESALKIPAGPARDQFLADACSGNPELQARIKELLRAAESQVSSGDEAAQEDVGPGFSETLLVGEERERRQIGPYKLLQQIGEGGMGIVFMAEQIEPVRRRVALKIIKPGIDTREVIARFEAERQALAMMDHPNIAKVLDAGTTDQGRPYFVMELVNGQPLTQYCDEHSLTTRERLKLFSQVCRAVQHAHQKGVIHRDLKPGNILVANYDHEAVPKVIDFGVAKATNQQLTPKTLFTHLGQLVGTLEYMSPEQARRNQLDVDTRSDIYSLGIVLYELLTGETPLDKEFLQSAAFDEVLRQIREQEPVLPSLKLSTSKHLSSVAARRRVDPARLAALVRGDLDWIVLKTLQKDRSERYATAQELSDDIRRYLEDMPIQAGPPRAAVRIRKFVKRNRWQVVGAASLLLVLALASVVFFISQQASAQRIADRSQRTSAAVESASLALGQAINSPIGNRAEWVALEAEVQRIEDLLADGEVSAEVNGRASALLAKAEEARAERDIAARLEDVLIVSASHPDKQSWRKMESELAALLAENGVDLETQSPQEVGKHIGEHRFSVLLADILELWIGTKAYIGGTTGSQAALEPWTEAIYLADDDPLRTGIRKLIYAAKPVTEEQVNALIEGVSLEDVSPRTLTWLSAVYGMAGMQAKSIQVIEDALRRHPTDVMLNFELGYRLAQQKRWHEATRMYSSALALRSDAAGIWQMMGIALEQVDELDNARNAYERACELQDDYAPTWVNLGNVLLAVEDGDAALEAGRQAIRLTPDHPAGYGIAGRALMLLAEYQQALPLLEKCDEVRANHPAWQKPSKQWIAECKRQIQLPADQAEDPGKSQ